MEMLFVTARNLVSFERVGHFKPAGLRSCYKRPHNHSRREFIVLTFPVSVISRTTSSVVFDRIQIEITSSLMKGPKSVLKTCVGCEFV
jgi:hypothetical protein